MATSANNPPTKHDGGTHGPPSSAVLRCPQAAPGRLRFMLALNALIRSQLKTIHDNYR
ncbi:hypothetical protein ART_3168 [Arthrobacter sp. PAMC 25486]|nr:hypothetical protein ART_3168 [Arthrobacter sp. PAMC 25486]